MPLLRNAKKALRVSKRKAAQNQTVKSRVKTMVDKVRKTANPENLSSAYSAIDKAVKKNIFHANKAARMKSQLSRLSKPSTK